MAGYRKIDPRIWYDAKFRALSQDGKMLFLCLLTHPDLTCVGAVPPPVPPRVAPLLGWSMRRTVRTLNSLFSCRIGHGFDGMVFFPQYVRYNAPTSPTHVAKAWVAALDRLPEGQGRAIVAANCLKFLESCSDAFKGAIPGATWGAIKGATLSATKGPTLDATEGPEAEAVMDKRREEKETPYMPPLAETSARSGTPTGLPQRAHTRSRAHLEETFKTFWNLYPRKTDRKLALRAWCNLNNGDREAALEALPQHVAWWKQNGTPPSKIKHASGWLNGRRWEDTLPAETSLPAPGQGWDETERRLQERRLARQDPFP